MTLNESADLANPYASPSVYYAPHRGQLILLLGILGVVLLPPCAPIAWIMGRRDLQAMRDESIDPAGKSQTQAGMILGILGTIICVCLLLILVLALARFVL